MRVIDVLNGKTASMASLPAGKTLADALALMSARGIGSVIVLDARQRPIGILTEPDAVAALSAHGGACLDEDVSIAMRVPGKCAPDETIRGALARMTRERVRYLLVIDAERLVGLVSIGDLVKARLENADLEASVLRDMARGALLGAHGP